MFSAYAAARLRFKSSRGGGTADVASAQAAASDPPTQRTGQQNRDGAAHTRGPASVAPARSSAAPKVLVPDSPPRPRRPPQRYDASMTSEKRRAVARKRRGGLSVASFVRSTRGSSIRLGTEAEHSLDPARRAVLSKATLNVGRESVRIPRAGVDAPGGARRAAASPLEAADLPPTDAAASTPTTPLFPASSRSLATQSAGTLSTRTSFRSTPVLTPRQGLLASASQASSLRVGADLDPTLVQRHLASTVPAAGLDSSRVDESKHTTRHSAAGKDIGGKGISAVVHASKPQEGQAALSKGDACNEPGSDSSREEVSGDDDVRETSIESGQKSALKVLQEADEKAKRLRPGRLETAAEARQRLRRDNFVRLDMRGKYRKKRRAKIERARKEVFRERWGDGKGGGRKNNEPRKRRFEYRGDLSQTRSDAIDDCLDAAATQGSNAGEANADSRKAPSDPRPVDVSSVLDTAEPTCVGHRLPAVLKTVRRSPKNRGRKYYCCQLAREDRCDFFMWQDDAKSLAIREFLKTATPDGLLALRVEEREGRWKSFDVKALRAEFKRRRLQTPLIDPIADPVNDETMESGASSESSGGESQSSTESSDGSESSAAGSDSEILIPEAEDSSSDSSSSPVPVVRKPVARSRVRPLVRQHRPRAAKRARRSAPRRAVAAQRRYPLSKLRKAELVRLLAEDDVAAEAETAKRTAALPLTGEAAVESSGAAGSPAASPGPDTGRSHPAQQTRRSGRPGAAAPAKASRRPRSTKPVSVDTGSDDDDEFGGQTEDALLSAALDMAETTDGAIFSVLRRAFGFDSFRPGQEWAIRRVLSGQSTLFVAATGTGKSLCYQLPAMLLPGLTVVVSPLIALMTDQMLHLPRGLHGVCLSGQQSKLEIGRALRDLRERRAKILFVSPERLASRSFERLVTQSGVLPPVDLVCVDEAHCVSAWSHNFRPSYLRLRRAFTEFLRARCVLALTATATSSAVADVGRVLGIPPDGMRVGSWRRDARNLVLSASVDANRQRALEEILTSADSPLASAKSSVIVYVGKQRDADVVAEMLRAQEVDAMAYHAGMSDRQRSKVQARFMGGRLRVVVATVAFGMGLDKADVRGVVHFHLPRTLEDYVQQTGRAGRDGQPAHCHVFLHDDDFIRYHSLAHSDGVGYQSVFRLLCRVFDRRIEEAERARSHSSDHPGAENGRVKPFEVAVSVRYAAECLGLRPEVLETLLTLLEQTGHGFVRPGCYRLVSIGFPRTPSDRKRLLSGDSRDRATYVASRSRVVAEAAKMESERRAGIGAPDVQTTTADLAAVHARSLAAAGAGGSGWGSGSFNAHPTLTTSAGSAGLSDTYGKTALQPVDIVALSRRIGVAVGQVQRELFQLQDTGEVALTWSDWSLRLAVVVPLEAKVSATSTDDVDLDTSSDVVDDLDDFAAGRRAESLQDLAHWIVARMNRLERARVAKVEQVYRVMRRVSVPTWRDAVAADDESVSEPSDAFPDEQDARRAALADSISTYFGEPAERSSLVAKDIGAARAGAGAGAEDPPTVDYCEASDGSPAAPSSAHGAKDEKESPVLDLESESAVELPFRTLTAEVLNRIQADARGLVSQVMAANPADPRPMLMLLDGRAAARILHGLSNPAFPSDEWRRRPGWGVHSRVRFYEVAAIAGKAVAEAKAMMARR